MLELTAKEMASIDEDELTSVMLTVDVLVEELLRVDRERWTAICMEHADLYVNRYYIISMRARIPKVSAGPSGFAGSLSPASPMRAWALGGSQGGVR